MSSTLSLTRPTRLTLVALAVLACAATNLPAQTAKKKKTDSAAAKKTDTTAKQNQAAPGTSQTVKLEEYGVQYRLPARWQQAQTGTPNVVSMAVLLDPKTNGPPQGWVMVRVLPLAAGATLDGVLAGVTKTFNCCGPHYKAVFGNDVALGGETARTVVLEPQEAKAGVQKVFLTGAQHGERAYVFTFVTKPAYFAKVLPDADKLLKSVKWLGPAVPPTEVAERKAGELLVDVPAAPAAAAPAIAAPATPPPAKPAGPTRRGRPGLKLFESPDGDFSLEYAMTWAKRDELPTPQAKLIVYPAGMENSPGNLAEHFVVVVDEPKQPEGAIEADAGPTGKDVAEQMVTLFKSGDPDARVLSQTDVKVDGVPAHRVAMEFTSSGFVTRRVFVCAVHEGKSYTFSYSADPAEFDRWAPLMDEITASVRWARPPAGAAAPPEKPKRTRKSAAPSAAKPAVAPAAAAGSGDGLD